MTEIFIHIVSLFYTNENKEKSADAEGDPLFDLFKSLWFNYLKVQLNFAGKMVLLYEPVKEYLTKVIDYLTAQDNILNDFKNPETKEG